jgi:hypothetical protein
MTTEPIRYESPALAGRPVSDSTLLGYLKSYVRSYLEDGALRKEDLGYALARVEATLEARRAEQ